MGPLLRNAKLLAQAVLLCEEVSSSMKKAGALYWRASVQGGFLEGNAKSCLGREGNADRGARAEKIS